MFSDSLDNLLFLGSLLDATLGPRLSSKSVFLGDTVFSHDLHFAETFGTVVDDRP